MKKIYFSLIAALMTLPLMYSCDSDDVTVSREPLQLVSVTPESNTEIESGVINVEFKFNQPVVIADTTQITFNGQPVSDAYTVATYLKAKVEIEDGSSNVFQIGKGGLALYSTDIVNADPFVSNIVAKAFVIPGPPFDISPEPCNPNVDDATRALYHWILKMYGRKAISGCTDGDDFDYAYKATGQTPLLRGYDMQPYSLHYPYKWSDGGHTFGPLTDNPTTPNAIAWYNDNGKKPIIAFTWHWHSPMGGKAGTNTFYTSETDFDASQAVIEGTAEYKATIADIDAIAVQLKKLQSAGIPVLWRPLHEGDGKWFWWGAKGPDAYIQLWNIMYDRLTNYHGLNNLLWVWCNGNRNWYVGDDKCDFVSNDVGPDGVYKKDFETSYAVSQGKKMLALSETGAVLDAEDALNQGIVWSYWMAWHDAIKVSNGNKSLYDLMNSSKTLTLERNY